MAVLRGPEAAIFFIGALCSSDEILAAAFHELGRQFGETLLESPLLPWDYTDYYAKELVPPVFRKFIFFERLVDASTIVDAKLAAMNVEDRFSLEGTRRINIDPGYMTLAKVVLASRKNYSHRIYLGRGVFAEVELFYRDSTFNALPYTYPDYRDQRFLGIFEEARSLLKRNTSRVT